jgi:hypothetical protein
LGDLLGSYRGRLFRPSHHISLLLSVPDSDIPKPAILNLVDRDTWQDPNRLIGGFLRFFSHLGNSKKL